MTLTLSWLKAFKCLNLSHCTATGQDICIFVTVTEGQTRSERSIKFAFIKGHKLLCSDVFSVNVKI